MKKTLLVLSAAVLLTLAALPALAGDFISFTVAAEGMGARVYDKPRGSAVGVLYNGFQEEIWDVSEISGPLYPVRLNREYTVYVNLDKAESLYPDSDHRPEGWTKEQLPFDAFLGQVREDNAVLRSRPDKRARLIARHAAGSQFMVWGEFGNYYLVKTGSGYGFMSKQDISEAQPPDKVRTYAAFSSTKWPYLEERTLYAAQGVTVSSDSAARFSEETGNLVYGGENNVKIRTYLSGGWAQLRDGTFIETRYLEPDGDHAPARTARVRTTSAASRLNVRQFADTQSGVTVKLCSGVEVEVISQTDEWAVVMLRGTNAEAKFGCVQRKYLEYSRDQAVTDGAVRARVTADLTPSGLKRETIPKDAVVTIVGVSDGFDAGSAYAADTFLILDENGGLHWIRDEAGNLEPISYPDIHAKTRGTVQLRAEPRQNAAVLSSIPSGTKVEVLLRGEGFTMVRWRDQTGYVLSRQLSF